MYRLAAVILAIGAYSPNVADACGVKFAPKAPHQRRVPAKTAKSSEVLVVGKPSKRLEHDLAEAGHHVEVAPDQSQAKQGKYDVVIVASNDQVGPAQQRFPGAAVIVHAGDEGTDLRNVEAQVKQRAMVGRTVIAAGPTKEQPISAGAVQPETKVAVKQPDQQVNAKQPETKVAVKTPETKVAVKTPDVKPAPEPVKEPVKEPVETKVAINTKPEPVEQKRVEPPVKQPVAMAGSLDEEIFFGNNEALVRDTRKLDKAVTWLKNAGDVRATVSGFADPTGTPEGNMTLSEQRANAVKDYLVKHGVDESRLDVTPYGDTKLKYGARDGRNRRVEIEAKRN